MNGAWTGWFAPERLPIRLRWCSALYLMPRPHLWLNFALRAMMPYCLRSSDAVYAWPQVDTGMPLYQRTPEVTLR